MARQTWTNRLTYILTVAGATIGFGATWRFPYLVGENGGGAYVLTFIIVMLLVGIPIILVENVIGRRAQSNSVDAFILSLKNKAGTNPLWKIVGYLGLWKIIDEAHITNLAVHPDFRRKGVAKLLLFDALEQCYKEKIKYLTLEVRVSNEGAINLYENFGFKSLGVRKKYYQNNNEDALIMWSENIFSENYKKRFNKIKEYIEGLILK